MRQLKEVEVAVVGTSPTTVDWRRFGKKCVFGLTIKIVTTY